MFWLTSLTVYGQNGVVITKRTAPVGVVSFSSSSVLTGISNSKHVDGYVKKNGTTTFTFPVGDNGFYRPFAAAGDGTTGAYFQENANSVTVPSGGPFTITNTDATLATVNSLEFWDINGSNASLITLSWNEASGISALTGSKLDQLTIAGWNTITSQWEKIESKIDASSLLGGTSNLTSGSITTSFALVPNTYSIYTLAATPAGPLPVTLVDFKAYLNDASQVALEWETSFEDNSERFNIQHSTDGKSWTTKGSVDAAGESSQKRTYQFVDANPVDGENLYRLKMIDRDGSFAYSEIEGVTLHVDAISLYPNPVSDKLYLKIPAQTIIKEIILRNLSGIPIYRTTDLPATGIDVKHISPGIYLIQVIEKNGGSTTNKILVGN